MITATSPSGIPLTALPSLSDTNFETTETAHDGDHASARDKAAQLLREELAAALRVSREASVPQKMSRMRARPYCVHAFSAP